mgnify:CR=1 FL=1
MSSPATESPAAAHAPAGIMANDARQPLVSVRNLKKYFPINSGLLIQRQVGAVKAVDDVSFDIYKGETLGVVGESGCGKSTTGRTVLQLYKPTSGSVTFEGKELTTMGGDELRKMRRRMQMIFQDPYASLNPRMSVGNIIAEPLRVHKVYDNKDEMMGYVEDLMQKVGLNPYYVNRYPHEFSGGQRQRIGIARALALEPKILVADEPVSALDVSIQAQVLELFQRLREELGLSMVFITHDLRVTAQVCDEIAVMKSGEGDEYGPTARIFADPQHEYTQLLLASAPGQLRKPSAAPLRGPELVAREQG